MTMSECESWDDVCNTMSKQSMQDQHHPDDLEFLTNQFVKSLAPEIENIVAILRKLQLPLDGIPMTSVEVDGARLEDESIHKEEEEDEEEEEERKSGDLRLAPVLIRLCRSDVEKSSTEEEANLCTALIQVLEELEMKKAADCLRRITNIWRKQATDKVHGSSAAEADQTQVPSPQKTSPGVASSRCHRTVLRETLATLVDRLAITDTLLSILTKKSVINQHMVALVLGRPNRQQQVVQLIELLTQLGPYSLQVFIEALTETDNIALANVLKWSLRHAPRDVDN